MYGEIRRQNETFSKTPMPFQGACNDNDYQSIVVTPTPGPLFITIID